MNRELENIENKFTTFKDEILKSSDPGLISAILITHESDSERGYTKKDEEFFEAVYGKKPDEYFRILFRKTPYISKVDFYNFIKHDAYYFLSKPITELAVSRFEKIKDRIITLLKKSGYEIIKTEKPTEPRDYHDNGSLYGVIVAKKGYEVAIHVIPFFYDLYWGPRERKRNEVLVFMTPVAKPEAFKGYVVVSLDSNHNVAKIVDNVNEKWSKEIAEIFNFMQVEEKINVYSKKVKDILEALVATVLERFGFRVSVDEKVKASGGVDVEVDVWAVKGLLKVYASCKNYSEKIGADIISNEVGRVMQLLEVPTVKIIVASEFTDQGKKVAERNGFIPIELGFKVDEKNIIKAYNIIYDVLKKYFGAP